jgi:hypothetical protein
VRNSGGHSGCGGCDESLGGQGRGFVSRDERWDGRWRGGRRGVGGREAKKAVDGPVRGPACRKHNQPTNNQQRPGFLFAARVVRSACRRVVASSGCPVTTGKFQVVMWGALGKQGTLATGMTKAPGPCRAVPLGTCWLHPLLAGRAGAQPGWPVPEAPTVHGSPVHCA